MSDLRIRLSHEVGWLRREMIVMCVNCGIYYLFLYQGVRAGVNVI